MRGMRWRGVAVLVAIGLVASGCSGSEDRPDRGASAQAVTAAKVGLDKLPALDPPADDASPRGLVGAPWTVWTPIARDRTASAVGTVGGVQVVLPAASGDNPTYQVFDDGSGDPDTPVYKGSSPNVSARLRNGGLYHYTVETSAGLTGPYSFTVGADGPIGGAFGVQVQPELFASGVGKMGIGLTFNTADVGATKDLVATTGLRDGLPIGWQWQGLGSGMTKVVVEDSGDFQGFAKIVMISREGGGTEVLGCKLIKSWGCTPLSGSRDGRGLQAVLSDDSSSTVTVTEADGGRTWTFETWSAPDPDDDGDTMKRREGRVTALSGPGQPRVDYAYAAAKSEQISQVSWEVGAASKPLTWTVFRKGDASCAGPTPPGFIAVPAGDVCGWELPDGGWIRLFYVDTKGDVGPQIGRVLRLPASCKVGDYTACQDSWQTVGVTDWAWSATGHPRRMRRPMVAQNVMANGLSAVDLAQLTDVTYDDLGRVATVVDPELASGGERSTATSTYAAADTTSFPGATHQVTLTTSAKGAGSQTTVSAVDDGLRSLGSRDATGIVTRQVWHPTRDVQLGRFSSDGLATTQTFDDYNRSTASFSGPASAFPADGTCSPGSAKVTLTSCVPVANLGHVTASYTTYDDGVPGGLVATWYASPQFGGSPIATTEITEFDDANGGLKITAPTNADVVKALADGGGLRITGGLDPADDSVPSQLTVDVTGGKVSGGAAFVNGRYYSGFTTSGSAVLPLLEGTKKPSYRFRADLAFDAPPTLLIISDPDDGLGGATYNAGDTKQRWGAQTEQRSVEAQPAGSATFAASSLRSRYDDPAANVATATDTVPCGTAGTLADAAKACTGAKATRTERRSFQDDGYGGRRLRTQTSPEGNVTTYEYWGRGDTPGDAGLSSASEIPDAVRGTAQLGLLRSTTTADGRTVTTVYDELGQAVCSQAGNRDAAGHWTCNQRDALSRPVRQVFRSADGDTPAVTVDYDYETGSGASPHTVQKTRTVGGKQQTKEVTSMAAAGSVTGYELTLTGGPVATTTYGSDAFGRPIDTLTTVTVGTSKATLEVGQTYTGSGQIDTVSIGGKPVAKARYDGGSPWVLTGWDYPGAGVSNAFTYDAGQRPTARNWTLAGGEKVEDSTALTTGGRVLSERLDGVDTTYAYDPSGRLTGATTGDRTTHYGFDRDGSLVCVARDLPSPAGSCATDAGHTTNTYANGILTATDDPEAKLPAADARYTANGNLRGVGTAALEYDGYEEVTKISDGDSSTFITRDASGRVVAMAPSATAPGTRLLYSSGDSDTPVASVGPDGAVQFATPLPGGLLWRSSGLDIVSLQGHPSIALTSAGARDKATPTRRYGPFGEDLTPKPAVSTPTPPSTTTTTAPATSTTSTTEPAASTSTTEPGATATTEPDAGADPSTSTTSSTTAPDGATTTTEAAATSSTTTSSSTTSTTSTTSTSTTTTTTTTTPATATDGALDPSTIWGWNSRISEAAGLLNLGRRTMIPRLGIFTSPDPVPGGSCTTYGYTCGDPINDSDLPGTFSWGQVVGIAVALVVSLVLPEFAGFMFAAEAGIWATAVATVVAGAAGGPITMGIADAIDGTTHSAASYGWSILSGAITGAVSGGVGFFLSKATYVEGELITDEAAYAYGMKRLEGDGGVDGYGLYEQARYGGYQMTSGLRRLNLKRTGTLYDETWVNNGLETLKKATANIAKWKRIATTVTKAGEQGLHKEFGWFN